MVEIGPHMYEDMRSPLLAPETLFALAMPRMRLPDG
jgi:hypothetical protein